MTPSTPNRASIEPPYGGSADGCNTDSFDRRALQATHSSMVAANSVAQQSGVGGPLAQLAGADADLMRNADEGAVRSPALGEQPDALLLVLRREGPAQAT